MPIKPLETITAIIPFMPLPGHAEFDSYNHADPAHRGWLTERIDQHLYCDTRFFGATAEDGTPLGAIAAWVEPRPPGILEDYPCAEIRQFAVAAGHRRQGIGTKLLQHLEAELRQQQVYCVYLHTYPADYDVIACYGWNGYMPTGLVPDVYGPGLEGMLFLSKVLR